MAALKPGDSQLADATGDAMIGQQQANVADSAAITGTAIAATVDAATSLTGPNVDEDGIAAGGFITRAARRTHVVMTEALLVDVDALRTWATEMDLDYTALLADVTAVRVQQTLILNVLEEHGLMVAS